MADPLRPWVLAMFGAVTVQGTGGAGGGGGGGGGIISRNNSTESLKEGVERSVMDEEILRAAETRKMTVLEMLDDGGDSSASYEDGGAGRAFGGSVAEAVFSKVVGLLDVGERALYRDPVYLLGKNVEVGREMMEKEEFLMGLFNSPS
jgi:hypothetical protein